MCQPFMATRAVVPECRRRTQRCSPGPKPTAAMHRSIQVPVEAVEGLLEVQEEHDARLLRALQVRDLLQVGQHVVPYPAIWQEGCLRGVHDLAEQRAHPAGYGTGCELVVRVEQRDGPVAGWRCAICPLALVEQGDAPLECAGGRAGLSALNASWSAASKWSPT